VIPAVPISVPSQMNIKSGLPAQVGPSEIQSTGLIPGGSTKIFVSRLSPDQTSSDVLSYIQDKTRENAIVEFPDYQIPVTQCECEREIS